MIENKKNFLSLLKKDEYENSKFSVSFGLNSGGHHCLWKPGGSKPTAPVELLSCLAACL